MPTQSPAEWPAVEAPQFYGHHRKAETYTHIWRPAPNKRCKERHETLCGSPLQEVPRRADQTRDDLVLCYGCREALRSMARKTTQPAATKAPKTAPNSAGDLNALQRFISNGSAAYPPLPDLLTGWQWAEHGTKGALTLTSPDGSHTTEPYTEPHRLIDWAVAWQRRQPLPRLPLDLVADWGWTVTPDGVQLVHTAESWATFPTPPAEARSHFDEARAILDRAGVERWRPGPDEVGVYLRPPWLDEHGDYPPADLVDGRWQPREAYDETSLGELADSVREHGVIAPLLVMVNEQAQLEIIGGHRRKRAALAVDRPMLVPVKVIEVTLQQAWEIALIDNDQRADLNDVERGQAYERIIAEQGISEVELAKRLGRARGYIQQRRKLATAAPKLQQALIKGAISFTQARGITEGSSDDHAAQEAALREVCDEARRGRTISGDSAKLIAEKAVQGGVTAKLEALGWKSARVWRPAERLYWYGGAERPQHKTAAELLTMARESRAPAGEPPAKLELTPEQRGWLSRAGYSAYNIAFDPWLKLERGNDEPIFLAGDELDTWLAPHIAAMQATIDELAGAGWQLNWYSETSEQWVASGPGELKTYGAGMADVPRLLKKAQAGEVSIETAPPAPPLAERCGRCSADMLGRMRSWNTGLQAYVCPDCRQALQAEQLAARQLAGDAAMGDGAWLDAVPDAVLRLVALHDTGGMGALGGFDRFDEDAAGRWAAAADRAMLLPLVRGVITSWAWDWHEDLGLTPDPAAVAARLETATAERSAAAEQAYQQLATRIAAVEAAFEQATGDAESPLYDELSACWEDLAGWQELYAGGDEDSAPELLERLRNLESAFDEGPVAATAVAGSQHLVALSAKVAAVEARIADGRGDSIDDGAELDGISQQLEDYEPEDVAGLLARIAAAHQLLAGAITQVAA